MEDTHKAKQPNQKMMLLISLALWLVMVLATQLHLRFSIDSLNDLWTTATFLMSVIVLYHSWRCPQNILKKVLLSAAMMLLMLFAAIAINLFHIVKNLFVNGDVVVQQLHVNPRDDVAVSEVSTGLMNGGVYIIRFEQRRQIFPGLQRVYNLEEVRCSGGGYATVRDQDSIDYRLSTGDKEGRVIQLRK